MFQNNWHYFASKTCLYSCESSSLWQPYICVCLDPMKAIRTELSLTRDEFDRYDVGVDAEVTFCLKEFRVCVFCNTVLYILQPMFTML